MSDKNIACEEFDEVMRKWLDPEAAELVINGKLPVWQTIEMAPRDGTWFVTARFVAGDDDHEYEVGRYRPWLWDKYVEVGDGLYRKEQEQTSEWDGFSNFHRATHWMPLPEPPE